MGLPTFKAPDLTKLFPKLKAVQVGAGLRHVGGSGGQVFEVVQALPVIVLKTQDAAPVVATVLALTIKKTGVVKYGTIMGVEPMIGGEGLSNSPPPTLTLPGTGLSYIVVTLKGAATQTTLAGRTFTTVDTFSSAVITVEGSDPGSAGLSCASPDGDGNCSYQFLLGIVSDGAPYNNGYGPISGGVNDTLDGSGTTVLTLIWPT